MELKLSKEDEAFRDEVRSFIAANYPTEMRVANPETSTDLKITNHNRDGQRFQPRGGVIRWH